MKFSPKKAKRFERDGLWGLIYNSKEEFKNANVVYLEVNGKHGKIKNTLSDRVYYIISGEGYFMINEKKTKVSKGDVMIIPKNTSYDFKTAKGKLKILLVSTPAFDRKYEVKLD